MCNQDSLKNYQIMSLNKLLNRTDLILPEYQRPYKWTEKNVLDLLNDISSITKVKDDYRYRLGSIILCASENYNNKYEIVDGQQRIITLTLILSCLKKQECNLMNSLKIKNPTQNIIMANEIIKTYFRVKNDEERQEYINLFEKEILEVVVFKVDEVAEAFQLFDSQNTRGKKLDPHALLKAYHLSKMANDEEKMKKVVTVWENVSSKEIKELFQDYLFNIHNWINKEKTHIFTEKDIDIYIGIDEEKNYPYSRMIKLSKDFCEKNLEKPDYFRISDTFFSGESFFEMVDYYLQLKNKVINQLKAKLLELNSDKEYMERIEKLWKTDTERESGFRYAKILFECSVLYYYDKFGNINKMALRELFLWAFMIRLDKENLRYDTVNLYAIGQADKKDYTNSVSMFERIAKARNEEEISQIPIQVTNKDKNKAIETKWKDLYYVIKKLSNDDN